MGFECRVRGDHHIFTMGGVEEIIIFWSEEDGSCVAEVPELPGCMADGTTYQDAYSISHEISDCRASVV